MYILKTARTPYVSNLAPVGSYLSTYVHVPVLKCSPTNSFLLHRTSLLNVRLPYENFPLIPRRSLQWVAYSTFTSIPEYHYSGLP